MSKTQSSLSQNRPLSQHGPLSQYGAQLVDDKDIEAVVSALRSGYLTNGPIIDEVEDKFAEAVGARFAVLVSSGTAALHLSTLALSLAKPFCGITSANTFVASANCISYAGGEIAISDIDAETGIASWELIEKHLSADTKVIVPVNFAGRSCQTPEIFAQARKRGVYVIEDACHALGSHYPDGSPVGSCKHSDLTIFSFHPVKTITSGEGGAITTNDSNLYRELCDLRSHGIVRQSERFLSPPKTKNESTAAPWYYEAQKLGFNYRLTTLQAALLSSQLDKLKSFCKRRRELVETYDKLFEGDELITPLRKTGAETALHLYVVRIAFDRISRDRAELMSALSEMGIGTQVHYIPLYRQPLFSNRPHVTPDHFPGSERYYSQCLSLPLHANLEAHHIHKVVEDLKGLVRS
jgi:perosamine synthetase